ncbi:MAG: hypothetical protein K2Q13_01485 [Nitrosomonas sp.]|uniref:hypothetical protein n=1 Tax=Nitrosomonas sp. TaxID=42353 RepID=UPI0025FB84CA|nr:hypothetical protein [Nitrosomonas sp.]MBY0473714.1 hypothetical protein [Nitrosomonas sp.]
MAIALFSRPKRRIVRNVKDVFIPGFGIKFPRSAYNNADSAGASSFGGTNGLLTRLTNNPNWRFVQFDLYPGHITQGPGDYGKSNPNSPLNKLKGRIATLAAMGVKSGLMFVQREFDVSVGNDVRQLLPAHLVSSRGTWNGAGGTTVHTMYEGCLGIEPGAAQGSGSRGYTFQYSNAMIQAWHREFFAAMAAEFDEDPNIMFVGTSESSYGTISVPFNSGANNPETVASMQSGRIQMVKDLKAAFRKTGVYHDMNHSKELAFDWYTNNVPAQRVWLSASNTHWNASTNIAASGNNPKGALRYYQDYSGILPKFCQWQGDDMNEINPATGVLHTMQDFHDRLTSAYIGANMCLIQYKLTAPSGNVFSDYDDFIKTLPLNGGLVSTRPTFVV